MLLWDHAEKSCALIEVACPLDINIISKENEKEMIYAPLLRNMQLMYPGYSFSFVPIIVGATGYVSHNLTENLQKLGIPKHEIPLLVRRLQEKSVTGTVMIVKTFLGFRII